MNPILERALELITERTNLSTGLTHPNDKNAAKEMFIRLRDEGIDLRATEITIWAVSNGWQSNDARELGVMAQQIGMGQNMRVINGPWWKPNIIDIIRRDIENNE